MQENRQRLLLDTGRGYFRREGVNVMAFDDIYPEGHQSGVSLILPVFNLTLAFGGLFGIGGGALLPKLLAQNEKEEAV